MVYFQCNIYFLPSPLAKWTWLVNFSDTTTGLVSDKVHKINTEMLMLTQYIRSGEP